jgi:hypothetical protein
MRRAALVAALLATVLAAVPSAASARTTRLVAYSTLDTHPKGYFNRGNEIHVLATNFIPPPLCRARVRFTLEDSTGRDFTIGRFRPSFGFDLGEIRRVIGRIPAGAAFGRASLRSRQNCRVGTASGRDRIQIVDPTRPPPQVLAGSITTVSVGGRPRITFRIDAPALVTVAVDYQLVPTVFKEVDVLTRAFRDRSGIHTFRWRASAGGLLLPAGPYRLRITPRAPAGAQGTTFLVPFEIRPATSGGRPGAERVAVALGAAAAALS